MFAARQHCVSPSHPILSLISIDNDTLHLMKKQERELRKLAKQHGFSLVKKGGHIKWQHSSGVIVFTGGTISDRRALKNIDHIFKQALASNNP